MAKKILVDLNLNQNELQNAVIQNLATAPTNPVAGQEYFNTTDQKKYIYDGEKWVDETNQGKVYTYQNGVKELTGADEGKVELDIASGANAGNITLTADANGLKAEVAEATNAVKGIAQFATDAEVVTGTAEDKIVNPKQLATKIGYEDLSIATGSTNYLGYDNTNGEISAKVDTIAATENSTNLITSGAVFDGLSGKIDKNPAITGATKTKITYDANGLVTAGADLEASDLPISIASASADYLVFNTTNGEISANVDTAVTASSTNLITSGAVKTYVDNAMVGGVTYVGTWDATGQSDYSGIELPVFKGDLFYVSGGSDVTVGGIQWNAGDFLIINEDVAAGGSLTSAKLSKIDNTEASDIVRLDAAQTLTNKTIDADDNTISNLEVDNFKAGVVVDSTTGIADVATASETKLATEKAIASKLADKVEKFAVNNGALTPVGGQATWTITNTLGTADVEVKVYEVATGEEVGVTIAPAVANIVITFNAVTTVQADTYKAVIIG